MAVRARFGRITLALTAVLVASDVSMGQRPARVVPPPTTPGMRARSLGREFMDKLRYPFYAIPDAFTPDPPPRTVLRPNYDGTLVPVPVPPQPIKPLFLSGYAGGRPPAPRTPLTPTTRGGLFDPGHGPFGSHDHRMGH